MQPLPSFSVETATEAQIIAFLEQRLAEALSSAIQYWKRFPEHFEAACGRCSRQHTMWIWVLRNGPTECRWSVAEDIALLHHGRAELLIDDGLRLAINRSVGELIRRYKHGSA